VPELLPPPDPLLEEEPLASAGPPVWSCGEEQAANSETVPVAARYRMRERAFK
jgi:hypothetical protein